MNQPEPTAPSGGMAVGSVAALVGLIADVVGFASAASQNWTSALLSGLAALLVTVAFFSLRSKPMPRGVVLLALLPAVIGSGFAGAAVGHWLTPATIVAIPAPPTFSPSPPTKDDSSSTPTSSSPTTPPTSTPGTIPNSPVQLLSELKPMNTNSVNSPRPVTIGTQVYPNSFTLGCTKGGTSVTYTVAGFAQLNARIGLDNGQSGNAAKAGYESVIRVTAEGGRLLGEEYRISLGKPADLSVPLDNAVQATIKCTLIDPTGGNSGYYQAAFGDATVRK
jgi:hypothetical protein